MPSAGDVAVTSGAECASGINQDWPCGQRATLFEDCRSAPPRNQPRPATTASAGSCGPRLSGRSERGGFEPPVPLITVRRFSKPFPSATRAPLRNVAVAAAREYTTPRTRVASAAAKRGPPGRPGVATFARNPDPRAPHSGPDRRRCRGGIPLRRSRYAVRDRPRPAAIPAARMLYAWLPGFALCLVPGPRFAIIEPQGDPR